MWTFTWQKGRQLANAKSGSITLSFTYDADGIRESKTVNGTTHNYLTMDGTIYQERWGNNTLTFAYDENGLPYSVTYNGTTYYYVLNQQGDVIRIVNASGATQAEYTYDAWGNVIASTDTTSGIGSVNPLRYRGYYWDAELGMYYLQSRYYDPVVKRFVNADDINGLGATCTFLSYNLYSYCLNSPVNNADVCGNFALSAVMKSILKGLAGALYSVVITYVVYRVKSFLKNKAFEFTKSIKRELFLSAVKGFTTSVFESKGKAFIAIKNFVINLYSEVRNLSMSNFKYGIKKSMGTLFKMFARAGTNTLADFVEDRLHDLLKVNIDVSGNKSGLVVKTMKGCLKVKYSAMVAIVRQSVLMCIG